MEYPPHFPAWKKLTVLAMAGMLASGAMRAEPVDPETLKLSYLWNFPKFVDWPEGIPPKGAHFNICIVGDEMVNAAQSFLQGRKRNDTEIAVLNGKRVKLDTCQLIYISASEGLRIPTVLAEVGRRPVLTVSDADNFAQEGGTIGLVPRDQKLGFEINLESAAAAGLKIRSTLAELAIKRY